MKINMAHIACIYCFVFGLAVENFRQHFIRENKEKDNKKDTMSTSVHQEARMKFKRSRERPLQNEM